MIGGLAVFSAQYEQKRHKKIHLYRGTGNSSMRHKPEFPRTGKLRIIGAGRYEAPCHGLYDSLYLQYPHELL